MEKVPPHAANKFADFQHDPTIFEKDPFHTALALADLIGDSEAIVGHRVVRLEPDVHPAPGRHVFGWDVAAAVSPDERRVGTAAVSDLHEIVPGLDKRAFSKGCQIMI